MTPVNDNLANARLITGFFGSAQSTTVDATVDSPFDPVDDYYGDADGTVWFRYRVPAGVSTIDNFKLQMVADDAPLYSQMYLVVFTTASYPPSNSGDYTHFEAQDSMGQYEINLPSFTADGGYIYVGVGSYGSEPHPFTITWTLTVFDSDGNPVGRVLIAPFDSPLEPDPTWYRIDDIDNLVAEIEISTGRQDELDETKTGTAVIRLNDRDGLFDPSNTSSPYFGNLDGKQLLVQLYNPVDGIWYQRFRGIIDDYGYDINPATSAGTSILTNVQIECVDIFDYLAGVELIPGVNGDTPVTGTEAMIFYAQAEVNDRQTQILDEVGIDTTRYVVFSGNVVVQGTQYDPGGDTALAALRDAADAEFPGIANIFCDRRGRYCFHGRGARIDPDTVAAGAGTTAWDFQRWKVGDGAAITLDPDRAQIRPPLSFARSRSRIINRAITTPMGVKDADVPGLAYSDATSIAAYGIHSRSWTDLIIKQHKTNGETANQQCYRYSQFWVENFKQPRMRVEELTILAINPDDSRGTPTWNILCRSDISDIVDLEVGFAGGVGVSEDFYIEGWTQKIRPLSSIEQGGHDMVELSLNVSPTAYYTDDLFGD